MFESESPVCAYWLTRCEGFKVVAGKRELGVVESVTCEWPLGRAEALVVRSRHRQTMLETEQVLAVVPAQELLLTERKRAPSRVRPAARAAEQVGREIGVGLARLELAVAPYLVAGIRAAGRALALCAVALATIAGRLAHSARRELPPAARAAAETIRAEAPR